MTRIFVATPEYTPALPWMRASLEGVRADLHAHGIETIAPIVVTGALILEARNSLVNAAHDAKATHVLWWDNDVSADDPTCVRAMLATGRDVIGGVYPCKDMTGRLVYEPLPGAMRNGDCIEVARIGTGFLLTSMAALYAMREAYPERMLAGDNGEACWALFRMPIVAGKQVGEDWAFCDDYRATGGKVFAHVPTQLRHWGYHGFTGSLETRLRT